MGGNIKSENATSSHNESNEENEKTTSKVLNEGTSSKEMPTIVTGEGKTVFIRNLSKRTTQDELCDLMQEYGDIEYCIISKNPVTNRPKGTGFVKFKQKESANKLISESSKFRGIFLDDRELWCVLAPGSKKMVLSRRSNEPEKRELHGDQGEPIKNFYKGLENVKFSVSNKRLVIYNIPQTFSDKDLKFIINKAAGSTVITECMVKRDFKKTDAQGNPTGFGFVAFMRHEDAVKVLEELNSGLKIFNAATQTKQVKRSKKEKRKGNLTKRQKLEASIQNKEVCEESEVSLQSKEVCKESEISLQNKEETEQVKRPKKENQKGNLAKRKKSEVSLENKETTTFGDIKESEGTDGHDDTTFGDKKSKGFVVHVRGLPWSATKEEIMKFFEGVEIKDGLDGIHKLSREDKPSDAAYFVVETKEDLNKALEKNEERMNFRPISVFQLKGSETEQTGADHEASLSSSCVKLHGLPDGCTIKEIYRLFSGFKIVPNGVSLHKNSEGGKAEAYVQFISKEIAEKAMEKRSEEIKNKSMEISKCSLEDIRSEFRKSVTKVKGIKNEESISQEEMIKVS